MSELTFYEKFHKNSKNKLIHILCIPAIVWSSFIYTHRFKSKLGRLSHYIFLLYLAKYYSIDKKRIFKIFLFYLAIFYHSLKYFKNNNNSLKIANRVFLSSWILQFLGHYIFEGNSPALLTGLVKSITIGPYFAFKHLEELFV